MKRATLLTLAVLISAGCSDILAPESDTPSVTPNHALVDAGIPYTQIDAQVQRLYEFNNCLTGMPPYSGYSANCSTADMTYDAATYLNWQLTSVFFVDVTTTKAQALQMVDWYLYIVEEAYVRNRLSCRGRYAVRNVANTLRTIINGIAVGQTPNLSALPQPLNVPLWTLNLFTGATYGGTPCGAAPGQPFGALNGYSLVALATTGSNNLELAGDEFYATNSAHSNSSVVVSGSTGVIYDNFTYRTTQSVTGSNNYLGNGLTLVSGIVASPITGNPAGAACTYSRVGSWNLDGNGTHWVGGTSASRQLRPGVYCASGVISMSVDNVVGNVTLKATGTSGRIVMTGDLNTLRAFHASGVVMYAASTATNAIELRGTMNSHAGHLNAPNGRVDILTDFTLVGAIVANRIRLLGDRINVVTATP